MSRTIAMFSLLMWRIGLAVSSIAWREHVLITIIINAGVWASISFIFKVAAFSLCFQKLFESIVPAYN